MMSRVSLELKQGLDSNKDMVKGKIIVKYSDYSINENLPDYIFKKKKVVYFLTFAKCTIIAF